MKAKRQKRISMIVVTMILVAFVAGCGGRSASGGVAALPAPAGARSTLKVSNVTQRTVVTVDGQVAPAASGTLTLDVAPGIHAITVDRAGYTVTNSADLLQVPTSVGSVVEKSLIFSREAAPLPAGWTAAARPVTAELAASATQTPPLP